MLVEQAVFTSARTQRLDGYQLVATSEGISAEDCQSLTQWCPAHDSLAERSPKAVSINFHPLASENHCISRTMFAGAEYSARGGGRILTHCFVTPPEVLKSFSNNPFRVLEAISAAGHIKYFADVPSRLEPIRLIGCASVIDRSLLRKLRSDSRCFRLLDVVAALAKNQSPCIVDERNPEIWLAALFSVLPVECRTQLSFCTGLQYSARRPFRCVSRRGVESDLRKSPPRNRMTVLDMDEPTANDQLPRGWAGLVHQLLNSRSLTVWERLLRCQLPGLRIEHLDALAGEMVRDKPNKMDRDAQPGGRSCLQA